MKIERQIDDFGKALARLQEALNQPKDAFIRDSAILRFELLFEIGWKTAQSVATSEGLIANSPKSAFQMAFQLGLINDEVIWSQILHARNSAVHTYHEALAEQLYNQLPGFLRAFEELHSSILKRR